MLLQVSPLGEVGVTIIPRDVGPNRDTALFAACYARNLRPVAPSYINWSQDRT